MTYLFRLLSITYKLQKKRNILYKGRNIQYVRSRWENHLFRDLQGFQNNIREEIITAGRFYPGAVQLVVANLFIRGGAQIAELADRFRFRGVAGHPFFQ